MRCVMYRRFGPPTVLEPAELETPEPRPHEVRIRVHATTVTAAECAMRRGEPRWGRLLIGFVRPRRRFRVLGTELAGVIDAAGEDVTLFSAGDRVFGFAGFRIGANAEYICLPQSASLSAMPTGMGFEEAAASVDGATTALHFLRDLAGLSDGMSVLVIGASGSIGTYAVQLAKHYGATVTGVCSAHNAELVRSLGADEVIDYTRDDPTAARDRYDVVFDTVGRSSFAAIKQTMKPGGRYLSTMVGPATLVRHLRTRWLGTRRAMTGMSAAKDETLPTIRSLLESGELRVVVDRTYPLEDVVNAHQYVETGRKRGNVVVTVA